MAVRRITRQRLAQPTDGAQVNERHWLAPSLLFASDGQTGLVWGQPTAPAVAGLTSSAVTAAGPLGGIQAWVPDGSGYVRWAIPPRAGNGITLGVWVQGVASTTNDQIFSISHATSANGGRSIRRTSTELYVANRVNSGLSNTGDASTAAATASTWQFVVGTFTSDTVSDVWLDGVKGPEGSGNSRVVTTVDSVLVGTVIPNGSTFETATTAIKAIGPAYLLDRVLSADEAVAWSVEALSAPWEMFAGRRIWVPVSASGPSTQTLNPALFTNSASFYSATVAAGAVTVSPPLLANSVAFYSPAVSSSITLAPGLYSNSSTFYGPTASPGPVTLSPPLIASGETFYAASVSNGGQYLTPGIYNNTNSFYAPTVTTGTVALTPALFTNSQAFYSASVYDPAASTLTRYFDVLSGKLMILKAL